MLSELLDILPSRAAGLLDAGFQPEAVGVLLFDGCHAAEAVDMAVSDGYGIAGAGTEGMGVLDSCSDHPQDGVDMAAGGGNSRPGAPRQVVHMVHCLGSGAKEQMNVLLVIHQPSPFPWLPSPRRGMGNQAQCLLLYLCNIQPPCPYLGDFQVIDSSTVRNPPFLLKKFVRIMPVDS